MVALIVGVLFLLFSAWSVVPASMYGLGWGQYIIDFLRGGGPLIAILIGIIAVFIGIADIKDKIESQKEEKEEKGKKESK